MKIGSAVLVLFHAYGRLEWAI